MITAQTPKAVLICYFTLQGTHAYKHACSVSQEHKPHHTWSNSAVSDKLTHFDLATGAAELPQGYCGPFLVKWLNLKGTLFSDTGSHVAQAVLKLLILLFLAPALGL